MTKNCATPKRTLRMAEGGMMPSELEQRLKQRLREGTLTLRGAGMLSDIDNQRRVADTQRYGIDTQAGTARMHDATQRFGIGVQADTARYGVDAQASTARMNDATNRFQIGTQADTQRYGIDTGANTARMNDATQRYGIGTQADTTRYGYDTSAATARMNDATNRYGMDLQADTSRYGYDSGRASSMYGADSNLLSNMWRMANGGEIRPSRLGLRNGGEIHAANGFMPGGYAERGAAIKWLSPYDGIKAQAALADMDLKQDALRAQTEALRAQTERADRGPTQDEVNAAKMAEDQARQRFAWEKEDRKARQAGSVANLRNGAQAVAVAAQPYTDTRTDAQEQRVRDTIRYGMAQDAAGRSAIAENNHRQDAIAAAHMSDQGSAGSGGYDPYEAQDRARLNERRNMYDKALRGHFNAGGFGAMRPGTASAAPTNFGAPRLGLRHGGSPAIDNGLGGAVPGTGKGDKIPAMYEPNEFVVSNDMLDAEPELRDHLRDLRERVLAAKGMTVAEADAKAMGGGRRLRADVGWGYDLEDLNQRRARDFGLTEEEAADIERKLQEKRAQGEAIRNIVANDAGPADLNQRRARDFGLTEEGAAGIDAKLQAKQARGAAIRNAVAASADADEAVVAKNDGVAKIAALNQRAADADAKVRTDTSRGVYRDVDPTMSPELAASREEGRRRDLRSYADAQSAALDAGKSAPALPKSLRDTGNIYKTVDDQGRVTYSGGVVKAGAKFIGGDGEEFTPGGSVEYAKPGTRFAATPDGKGVAFTPVSEDKNQRAADIAQNAVDIAKWKAKEAAEAPLRAKEQERQDMIGEVRSMEQAAMSGDNRAAALLPGARNLLADRLKTDALERSEAEKNAAHIKGIEIQTKGTRDTAEAKRLIERENELLIAKALDKAGGNSEATVDLLSKAGRGDLAETLSKRVTSDNDRRTKDYENMIGEFKKLGVRDAGTGEEIPGGAEMAAQLLLKRTGGKIVDADKRAEMMREAILEARLLHGMQQKARGRNSSLRTWFAGDDNIPTDLPASSAPKKLSPWDGAWTFGGVEAGDYDYGGGRYLPATVGRDAIEHAKKLAKRKAGIE